MKLSSCLTLLTGVAAISFAAVFIRLAEAPPFSVAAYRLVLAAAVLLPFTARKAITGFSRLRRRDLPFILFSSLLLALHFALWITSLSYTSIASSVILVTAHPVFVAGLSYLFFKEKLGRKVLLGLIFALAGVVVINYGGFRLTSEALLGNVLALVAGLAMGAYLIIGRHYRLRLDAGSYLTVVYGLAGLTMVIVSITAGQPLAGFSPLTFLMLALLALVPQLIGHTCLNLAVRQMSATVVSVAILGEPIGATLLGLVLLGEIPAPVEILGGVLTLAGIYAVVLGGNRR